MATQDEIKFLANPNIGSQKKNIVALKNLVLKHVDYKDENFLIQFVNEQGKLLPRRLTGNSLKFQRRVASAVKRARHLAILPFVTDLLK